MRRVDGAFCEVFGLHEGVDEVILEYGMRRGAR